ncbi:hypothetical protein [Nocardia sp. R7R-8]|uniref:hypothetical protein n=1 Tax=Nocardia sp. R7R-8 TaxID=3459304 RepID=UPI00403DC782
MSPTPQHGQTARGRRSSRLPAWTATAACTGPGAPAPAQTPIAAGTGESVAVVTRAGPGDAFWNVVANGAEAAGRNLESAWSTTPPVAGRRSRSTTRWRGASTDSYEKSGIDLPGVDAGQAKREAVRQEPQRVVTP